MIKLVEIEEAKIQNEMTAVIYDCLSHNSTHYIGLFPVYMHIAAVFKNRVMSSELELEIPLLAASAVTSTTEKGNDAALREEATKFLAKKHIR